MTRDPARATHGARPLRIATRKSALALWQTHHVAERLRALRPGLAVELVPLSTRGDEVLDRSLATIGGKGLFLKELEIAMIEGQADCAVHSLKDVPMELDTPFVLPAILERADPFDAFVSNHHDGIEALPSGARVGTSSLRRQVQLRVRRPDLSIVDLRGNVNTRLAKLDAGEFDAILLACAGLHRLGFEQRIRATLAAPEWLPAAAQGAIAIECRGDDRDVLELMAPLDHAPTRTCVEAERAMTRALQGSCQVPIAAYCVTDGSRLSMQALVGSVRDERMLRAEADGDVGAAEALGRGIADELIARGARELLGD
jgi:hydroxymethylbilane synthase